MRWVGERGSIADQLVQRIFSEATHCHSGRSYTWTICVIIYDFLGVPTKKCLDRYITIGASLEEIAGRRFDPKYL